MSSLLSAGSTKTFLVGAVLWLSASYAVAISRIQMFEPSQVASSTNAYDDALHYINMTLKRGAAPSPFRYRILGPAIAAGIPDAMVAKLTARPNPTPEWLAGAKLSILNFVVLSATGLILFVMFGLLGFGQMESMIGSILFFTTRPVVQFASVPLIDSLSWLFLAACLVALIADRYFLLAAVFLVGMTAKETLLLVIPFALLTNTTLRSRSLTVAALLPGLVAFVALRLWYLPEASPDPFGSWWSTGRVHRLDDTARRWFSLGGFVDLASSFGLLWIPAVYGFLRIQRTDLLRRWAAVIPALLLTMFWLSTNLGRLLFNAFPVVLPLALIGWRAWLQDAPRSPEPAVPAVPR